MSRSEAYRWLAERMSMPIAKTHMIQMNVEQCRQVVDICAARAHELIAQQFDVLTDA